jgi:hypothetical protein
MSDIQFLIYINSIAYPNLDFDSDDCENDADETILAKFLLRHIITNRDLLLYFDEIGFYSESDIPYVDKELWDIIYRLIAPDKEKRELIKLLRYIQTPIYIYDIYE